MGQARQSGTHSGSGAPTSAAGAGRGAASRSARQSARAAGRSRCRGGGRPDSDRDRESRGSGSSSGRQLARGDKVMAMHEPVADRPAPARDPWRRRLVASLLYGRDVDRAAKTRGRIALALCIFALGYAVLAARPVVFPAPPEGPGAAAAPAPPDTRDSNGEILATDVRTPSLFAEPHRIIDVDEASELLTAVMPDIDAAELRGRLASKRRFVWLKREITPEQRAQIHRLGIPGVGFLPENKRVYPN